MRQARQRLQLRMSFKSYRPRLLLTLSSNSHRELLQLLLKRSSMRSKLCLTLHSEAITRLRCRMPTNSSSLGGRLITLRTNLTSMSSTASTESGLKTCSPMKCVERPCRQWQLPSWFWSRLSMGNQMALSTGSLCAVTTNPARRQHCSQKQRQGRS